MAFCTNCGGSNNDSSKFCMHCGSPLSVPVNNNAPASEPVAAEPAVAEPAVAEPVIAEPEPVAAEPEQVVAAPVFPEPVLAEPQPVVSDVSPVIAAPVMAAAPVIADPMMAAPQPVQPVTASPEPVQPMFPSPAPVQAAAPVFNGEPLIPDPAAAPAPVFAPGGAPAMQQPAPVMQRPAAPVAPQVRNNVPKAVPAPAAKSGINILCLVGLILGLLSLICIASPFLISLAWSYVVCGAVAFIALIISIIGIISAKKKHNGGKGMGVFGMILSILVIVALAASYIFIFYIAQPRKVYKQLKAWGLDDRATDYAEMADISVRKTRDTGDGVGSSSGKEWWN